MADRKLAAIGSFLFLALVAMLLLVLYYPETAETDDEAGLWTPETVRLGSSVERTDPPETVSKMAAVARVMENMGAGFLALLAVVCVAFGLACLTCACCVVR